LPAVIPFAHFVSLFYFYFLINNLELNKGMQELLSLGQEMKTQLVTQAAMLDEVETIMDK
jgi:hypothetical protein